MTDFSCSIGTEVKENHCIAVGNGMHRSVLFNHRRKHKFIIYLFRIRSVYCLLYGRSLFSRAVHHGTISLLHSVIVLISIHSIVSAGNRGYLSDTELPHLLFHIHKEGFSGIGRSVSTVQESMQVNFL